MASDDVQRAIERFAADLGELRTHVGKPSFARIQNLSKLRNDGEPGAGKAISLPSTTASDAIRGRRLPSAATVLAFVDACRRAAAADGLVVDAVRFDQFAWQQRWEKVRELRDSDKDSHSAADSNADEPAGNARGDAVDDAVEAPAGEDGRPISPSFAQFEATARLRTQIDRRARMYATEFETILSVPHSDRRKPELEALNVLQDLVGDVLDYYANTPMPNRLRNNLVFADVYFEADSALQVKSVGDARRDLHPQVPVEYLAALLAAEVEYHGPVRLNHTENAILADVYERVGRWMSSLGLYSHAAFAFKRASIVHYQNEEPADQERCELARARALRKALSPSLRSIGMQALDLLCGYGYLPFRMLGWMAIQMILFTFVLVLVDASPNGPTPSEVIYESITNYVSPIGPGDTQSQPAPTRVILPIESLTGTITALSFAVLLSRRLLRISRR